MRSSLLLLVPMLFALACGSGIYFQATQGGSAPAAALRALDYSNTPYAGLALTSIDQIPDTTLQGFVDTSQNSRTSPISARTLTIAGPVLAANPVATAPPGLYFFFRARSLVFSGSSSVVAATGAQGIDATSAFPGGGGSGGSGGGAGGCGGTTAMSPAPTGGSSGSNGNNAMSPTVLGGNGGPASIFAGFPYGLGGTGGDGSVDFGGDPGGPGGIASTGLGGGGGGGGGSLVSAGGCSNQRGGGGGGSGGLIVIVAESIAGPGTLDVSGGNGGKGSPDGGGGSGGGGGGGVIWVAAYSYDGQLTAVSNGGARGQNPIGPSTLATSGTTSIYQIKADGSLTLRSFSDRW